MRKINIQKIIEKYDSPEVKVTSTFLDGGLEPFWPRFGRALLSQLANNPNAITRYAIWANTVRDNNLEAMTIGKQGKIQESNVF